MQFKLRAIIIKRTADFPRSKFYTGSAFDMEQKVCDFLKKRVWAVVGASNNQEKYGYRIYKTLDRYGYTVYPVNPREKTIEGRQCYSSLAELPVRPDVADLVVPPAVASAVVKECAQLGIDKVWFQPGVDDENVLNTTRQLGLNYVNKTCAMVESSKRYTLGRNAWAVVADSENSIAKNITDFLHEKGYTTHMVISKTHVNTLEQLPFKPDVLAIATDPVTAEAVIRECRDRGISFIWLQEGYESEALINLALSLQITVVHHASIIDEYSSVTGCKDGREEASIK
jgi:predicted CoA-binding protein